MIFGDLQNARFDLRPWTNQIVRSQSKSFSFNHLRIAGNKKTLKNSFGGNRTNRYQIYLIKFLYF